MEVKGQVKIEKLISLVAGYLILITILIAAIYFVVTNTAADLGRSILSGVFGAIIGAGLLKRIKRQIILSDDQIDQVDAAISPGNENRHSVLRPLLKRNISVKTTTAV